MTGEPGAQGAPHPTDERAQGQDVLGPGRRERDPLLAWVGKNPTLVWRLASGERPVYWILGIGFVVGLVAHVGGFLLKTSATTEPLLLVGDLIYTFGWALWTGAVVVMFVQILPEVKRRQYKQALDAYEAAVGDQARAGNVAAMVNLGALLAEQGEDDQAMRWYRKAAGAGNTSAMVNLAALLAEQGEEDQAMRWYRKAASAGNTSAMVNLGALLAEQGEEDQAVQWYRKAASAGNVAAMVNLAALLGEQGEEDQAVQWYRKAAGAGNTSAMVNLAALLAEQGEEDQAVQWYRKAASAGNVAAAVNLAALLAEQGKEDQTEQRYRKSADAGRRDG